jgi:hypothetical protein
VYTNDDAPHQNIESLPWLSMHVRAASTHGVLVHVIARDMRHQATISLEDGLVLVGHHFLVTIFILCLFIYILKNCNLI